jgi:hypothetical protein
MGQEFGGVNTINLLLAIGGCFSVILLCFYAISRQLSYLLWAAMLAAVAGSLLMLPRMAILILAVGMAAASILVLVSGIQARRAHAALQAELSKLNDAVAGLQGRLVLRLGTPGLSAETLSPAEAGSPVGEASKPRLIAEHTESSPSNPVEAL